MKKVFSILIIIVLLFSSLPLWSGLSSAQQSGQRRPIKDLQILITGTKVNGTLIVEKGIYKGPIYIDKSITLIGEDRENTVITIDANDTCYDANTISVLADYVNISNLTISNSLYGNAVSLYGNNLNISQNNIYKNDESWIGARGIYVEASDDSIIEGNKIETTDIKTYSIYISSYSDNNYIHNNSMTNGSLFIDGEEIDDYSSQIIENTNTLNGKLIEIYRDKQQVILNDHKNPVMIFNCSNIKISNSNYSGNCHGILIVDSRDIEIINCQFYNNIYGILFMGCKNISIAQNVFKNSIFRSVYFRSSIDFQITSNKYIQEPPYRSPYVRVGAVSIWNCSQGKVNNNRFRDLTNFSSVHVFLSSNVEIEKNIIENTTYGIKVYRSDHLIINKNTIKGINRSKTHSIRNGIFIEGVNDIQIEGNYFTNISYGITLDTWRQYFPVNKDLKYTTNLTISNNVFFNVFPAIDLIQVKECEIVNNDFTNCGYGIESDGSSQIVIQNNAFEGAGIFFDKSSDNLISNNSFHNSFIGFMYSSHRNEISYNIFNQWNNNSYTIRFMLGCSDCKNTIYMNAFLGMNRSDNTSIFSGGTNYWHKNGQGNFWWNWTSPDHDLDGIVDVPFRIPSRTETYDEYPLTHYDLPDSDEDGVPDVFEEYEGTDPFDGNDVPPDLDNDGQPDSLDMDRDGDGYENEEDLYPDDPDRWEEEEGIPVWVFVVIIIVVLLAIVAVGCFLYFRYSYKKQEEEENDDESIRKRDRIGRDRNGSRMKEK